MERRSKIAEEHIADLRALYDDLLKKKLKD